MQRRFGTPEMPSTAFCPNCHVKIAPGTQICSNCESRICTHCYQVIPSLTARVCPKCGKPDILTKPLKDIRMESALKRESTASYTTATEYICPICSEKMVLLHGGTLKCQSRSCGYIIGLQEFTTRHGQPKADNVPPQETFTMDTKPPREKAQPKFFEVAKSKVREKMDAEESSSWEDLTTSIETKAQDQYFWKSERLGRRRFGSGGGEKESGKWKSSGSTRETNIQIPWRKIGVVARFAGLIIVVGLIGFGVFSGVRALIDSDIFDNIAVAPPPAINSELAIASLQHGEITDKTAIIIWETNVPASGQVEYGISEAMGYKTELDGELTTAHSISINGLQPETTYYFKAIAMSENGKQVVNSQNDTFTTASPPDTVPPVITDIRHSSISDVNATIIWTTDENTSGKIEYGTSPGKYTLQSYTDTEMKTVHNFTLAELSPSKTYYYVVTSADSSDNSAVSEEYSFTTLALITEGNKAGNRAYDFTLPTLEGGDVTLSDYRGKIVLLNFWFTSCGGCVGELPYIEEIHETWTGAKELQVLTIDIRDFTTNVKKHMTKYGYTFPVLLDTDDTKIWEQYGVTVAPKTFFIDTNGVIYKVVRGSFRNSAEIAEILDSM